jgi:putative transposase
MLVRKSFQFRLRPTKRQEKLLLNHLDECRWLYNELLEQRKLSHEELDISLSKYQQLMFLPLWKMERPSLTQIHSQILQDVVDRLDKAFQGFFRQGSQRSRKYFGPRIRWLGSNS